MYRLLHFFVIWEACGVYHFGIFGIFYLHIRVETLQFWNVVSKPKSLRLGSFEKIGSQKECGSNDQHMWLSEFNLGLDGCYEKVLADDRCKVKSPFMYADGLSTADRNCGCATVENCNQIRHDHVNLYTRVSSKFLLLQSGSRFTELKSMFVNLNFCLRQ